MLKIVLCSCVFDFGRSGHIEWAGGGDSFIGVSAAKILTEIVAVLGKHLLLKLDQLFQG